MFRSVLLPSILLLVGCTGNDRLPTYEAFGVVGFPDGAALSGGFILFQSMEHGKVARSVIEADGTFRLRTFEPGDGALAGKHRVSVIPAKQAGFDPDEGTEPATLHVKYQDAELSGLVFEVTPEGPNDFRVVVERAPATS